MLCGEAFDLVFKLIATQRAPKGRLFSVAEWDLQRSCCALTLNNRAPENLALQAFPGALHFPSLRYSDKPL